MIMPPVPPIILPTHMMTTVITARRMVVRIRLPIDGLSFLLYQDSRNIDFCHQDKTDLGNNKGGGACICGSIGGFELENNLVRTHNGELLTNHVFQVPGIGFEPLDPAV